MCHLFGDDMIVPRGMGPLCQISISLALILLLWHSCATDWYPLALPVLALLLIGLQVGIGLAPM